MRYIMGENKPGWFFRMFNSYIRLFLNKFYFRKTYSIDTDNIPEGVPLMVVSNHQNTLCDPLALLLDMPVRKERKFRIITRASVFNNNLANSALRWLGLLPAYRLAVDGEESLSNNAETFETVENELLHNGTIIIFPEGRHQNKHWLGEFSTGYLRMMFDTAEKSNFEKELFILPTCNHYSDYSGVREQMLIKYGTPVSLKPYYELYKTKPRTAQRQVNALVRKQVSDLMLDITDLENYTAIDFLRGTYGIKFACNKGFNPSLLPEKLLADKELFATLNTLKAENEEKIQKIYDETDDLNAKMRQLGICDSSFDRITSFGNIFFSGFFQLLLFPVYAFSLIVNLLVVYVPRFLNSKVKDPMMHSAVQIFATCLFTVPLTFIFWFILTWIVSGSVWLALAWIICLPLTGLFVVYYRNSFRTSKEKVRFRRLQKQGLLNELVAARRKLWQKLDELLMASGQVNE